MGEPTRERPEKGRHEPDPSHDVEYGGDLQQDDTDAEEQEGGRKGGHPRSGREDRKT